MAVEEEGNDSPGSPGPEPSKQSVQIESSLTEEAPPKKTKRLTLQERLALAAKTKSKKVAPPSKSPEDTSGEILSRTGSQLSLSESPLAVHNQSIALPKTEENREKKDIEKDAGEKSQQIPKVPDFSTIESETPTQTVDEGEITKEKSEESTPSEKCQNITKQEAAEAVNQTQIGELQAEISRLKNMLAGENEEVSSTPRKQASLRELERKLAEKERALALAENKIAQKDKTIEQLMAEGQELSKKELKSNERIRTLVANNVKLEASLKSYSEKNEESLLMLGEIEDVMKSHKIKSVQQLLDLLTSTNQKVADLQQALDKEKDFNWEGKYKEMQRLYERELQDKKEYKKELSELQVQLDIWKSQSEIEINAKDDIINTLNREIMSMKEEGGSEVARLEAKIESLRMENESFLKTPRNSSLDASSSNGEKEKKLIDYGDYAKLSDAHQSLQSNYVSSQENWKLIESNLLNKIEMLTSSVETMKKTKIKTSAETKKLHSRLSAQMDEIHILKTELAKAYEEKNEIQFQLKMKSNDCTELEEKIEDLRNAFATDRQKYDAKINELNEVIQNLDLSTAALPESASMENLSGIQAKKQKRDSGLQLSFDHRQTSREFSSFSRANSVVNTPGERWEEPSFVSEARSNSIYENPNLSSFSLTEEIYPYDALDARETSANNTPTIPPSSGATRNIQLINKMSSSIRRLEIQILTLKDENRQISSEKDSIQHELANRLDVEKRAFDMEQQLTELKRKLEENGKKEETLLEVIGEKSEKVEELQADIVDLKDLLKQQVQQMIEMQNM